MVLFFWFELKMAVHAAHEKKNICDVKNFWCFLSRVNFILMFLQEKLAFLLSEIKPFSDDLEG